MTTASWAGATGSTAPVVLVHYGSPHSGRHLPTVARLAAEHGLRALTIARPGYGDAPRIPGRSVADAARLALDELDAAGIGRFATLGYSGGGPHALAVAALAGDRVSRVATLASPAPYDGTDAWLEGIRDRRGLEAALLSREARERHEQSGAFDPESFTEPDHEALAERWAEVGADAQSSAGSLGAADDDSAFVASWGVDLDAITARVTLVHGTADRVVPVHHARLLADAIGDPDPRIRPGDGHIGVLDALPGLLEDGMAD